jgi:hypothetical protein
MVGRCGCVLGLRARPLGTDILLRCARELAAAGVPVDGVKRPLGPKHGDPKPTGSAPDTSPARSWR